MTLIFAQIKKCTFNVLPRQMSHNPRINLLRAPKVPLDQTCRRWNSLAWVCVSDNSLKIRCVLYLDHPVLYMSGIKIDSSWRLQSCHSRHSLSESVVIVGIHFSSEFNCCCFRSSPFANRCCCNFNCHQYSITTTVYWTKTNIGGYKLYAGTGSST